MWEQVHALVLLIIFTNSVSFSESTLNDDPHWVKYNPADGPLPADAIVGGYGGYENETLYIARAPHVGSLTPGKYIPSKHKAIISWGWMSHVKNEFEILCGRNYKWVPTTTDNIPEGAVVGGYIQGSYEPLYVGRVHYSGQILPGKVAVSHGVLYFGYEDRDIDVKNFEILVKTTDSSSEDYPHWVTFNPANNALPADAIVGGYEDETLYIARAPHVGSLTPGKYVPSTHKAIIGWGWLSHVKTEFEILCGRNYKWVPTTTDNIPEGAVVGGYIQNSHEPLYVGRVFYKGQITIPGKVAVSHKVLYFANRDKEIAVKYFEILVKTSKPAPREYPHWVKYNPANGPLPADAIVGGYGENQNETLYIARAPHVGSLTPGKYVPSRHQAIISWGWSSHVKTEFEILVGRNYKWVPTTVHYIPDGAVVGGYIQDSYEPLFVGRVHYMGQILPGKVAVSHGVLYFGYKDREIDVKNFEILVFDDKGEEKPKITGEYNVTAKSGQTVNIECEVTEGLPKPLISWQFRAKSQSKFVSVPGFTNTLNISNVNATDAGTYKCVATNDVGDDEHLTELIVQTTDYSSKDYPHWVTFNPANNTLPADAIVGGYEDETLYIARAPHVGSLTPGKYVPSTHKAIIGWGWLSHVKTEFEILCGRNYKWVPTTTDNIPEGAVVGGYIQNSHEPLYVGRVFYKGQVTIPGKVAVSHKVLYFANGDKEIAVKYFEILVKTSKPAPREYPHWVKYNPTNGPLPADAIVGGYGENQNETLYIARAPHVGSLTPGKYVPSRRQAIISWGWWSHVKTEFEILVGRNYKWVPTTVHYIPDGAVVGGYIQDSYEPLFVGRVHYMGQILPGKVAVSHGVLYFGYKDREIDVKNFEILVFDNNVEEKPKITGEYNVTATSGQTVNIECEVTKGVPKPLISWQFRAKNHSKFVSIPGSTNALNISNVNATDAGTYKCVATNDVGDDEHLTELIVQKSTIFNPNPHWVQFNPATEELPDDAIVGGYQNETLYIARAPHEGSLTPGMYVPSTHKAYVTWSYDAHPKTEIEILCGRNYEWVPTTTDYIPDGAVVGGYIENSYETEYIGRTNYSGYVIPGKVAVSHGVLYFAYGGRTTAVRNFEILVEIKKKGPRITGRPRELALKGESVNIECKVLEGIPKPTISWQFKAKAESSFVAVPGSDNVLHLSNVNVTDAGIYKCVANNDAGHDELFTELLVITGVFDPHWVAFNPDIDTLPADAIVGGYENETLYIALAEHEESMNPGTYIPSEHKAYVTWGNDAHPKTNFQILRGDNYVWVPTTTDYIPDNAFVGGYIGSTYETLYVCKANYSDHVIPGKVAVSHGMCYIAYRGKTVTVKNFEILVVPEKRGPRITGKDRETVVEGQSVNIECRVYEGIPEPTISWEYKSKSGYKFVPVPGSDNILRISRANETDAGTYRCVATNDLGYEMHRTELIVQTVLDDYGIINEVDLFRLIQSSTSSLKCGYGKPSATISWFHNGVSTETKGESYVLENLNMSFEGHNYTCRVSVGNVTEVHTFVMTVSQLRFSIHRRDPIFLDLTDSGGYELNCDFVANTPANISWTFNDKLMDNQKSSRLTFAGNWGNYTCKVTTIQGTIQRSFIVTSSKCIIPREPKYVNTTPIILTAMSDYTTDYMKVEPGQILTLSCPNFENKTNHFQMFPLRHKIKAHCVKGDQFVVKDKSYKLSDLVCANEVQAAVFKKHQKCWTNNNNSELLGVGYGFSETFEVCFDTANNIPLYIPGKISKWNRGGDVTYQWHKYRALGARRDTLTCDNAASTCCYTKAQLVNARDFSAGAPQRTSFIDPLNAVMLWRPCNLLPTPWEVMEISIRMMTALKDEFRVWSGTYMPQNINGTIIPRILFKAVEKTMAIIYINGPSPSKEDILCTNLCPTSPAWPYEYRKYIYCCDLEDFLLRFGLEATNVGDPIPGGVFHNARLLF